MRANRYVAAFAVALLCAPPAARAQDLVGLLLVEGEEPARDLSAVDDALEITIAMGGAQAFGQVSPELPNLSELGVAGWSMQLGVGYRLLPPLTLGIYGGGTLSKQSSSEVGNLYSALAGFKADWHFLPGAHLLDPWVSLGAGWRGYWIEQSRGATALYGFDVAKLQVGFDYRAERRAAVGPVMGLDLSRFVWQAAPDAPTMERTANPRLNAFVFIGVMGRLEIPTRDRGSRLAAL